MNKLKFLLDLYKKQASSDYGKFIAMLYHFYEDNGCGVLDADYLLSSNIVTIEGSAEPHKEIGGNDYRINKLSLSNFRKFPAPKNPDMKYAVNFIYKGKPASLYLTGANGTGKSSLFYAIQYAYSGHVDGLNARQMVFGFERQAKISTKEMSVKASCSDGIDLTGLQNLPFPHAMFCSEKDVTHGDNSEAFIFLLNNLGYADLLSLESDLLFLKKSLEEKKKLYQESKPVEYNAEKEANIIQLMTAVCTIPALKRKVSSLIKYCDEIIRVCKSYLEDNLDEYPIMQYKAYMGELTRIKKELQETFKDERLKPYVNKVCSSIKEGEHPETWMVEDFPRTIGELEVYEPATYLKSILQEVNNVVGVKEENLIEAVTGYIADSSYRKETAKNTVVEGERVEKIELFLKNTNVLQDEISNSKKKLKDDLIRDYLPISAKVMRSFSPSDEEVVFVSMDDTLRIRIKNNKELPSGEKSNFDASPEEYYNTFRYKLYIVSLKIASLFAYMKQNNCKLPFVMDDVFCASDFDNSNRLEEFVRIVYSTYKELFAKDDFQMILLTHDSVVQKAFKEGSQYLDDGKLFTVPYQAVRLFHYESSDEIKTSLGEVASDYEPITL